MQDSKPKARSKSATTTCTSSRAIVDVSSADAHDDDDTIVVASNNKLLSLEEESDEVLSIDSSSTDEDDNDNDDNHVDGLQRRCSNRIRLAPSRYRNLSSSVAAAATTVPRARRRQKKSQKQKQQKQQKQQPQQGNDRTIDVVVVDDYGENDILSGDQNRFGQFLFHPGNKRYNTIVKKYRTQYQLAKSGGHIRHILLQQVLDEIQSNGARFLTSTNNKSNNNKNNNNNNNTKNHHNNTNNNNDHRRQQQQQRTWTLMKGTDIRMKVSGALRCSTKRRPQQQQQQQQQQQRHEKEEKEPLVKNSNSSNSRDDDADQQVTNCPTVASRFEPTTTRINNGNKQAGRCVITPLIGRVVPPPRIKHSQIDNDDCYGSDDPNRSYTQPPPSPTLASRMTLTRWTSNTRRTRRDDISDVDIVDIVAPHQTLRQFIEGYKQRLLQTQEEEKQEEEDIFQSLPNHLPEESYSFLQYLNCCLNMPFVEDRLVVDNDDGSNVGEEKEKKKEALAGVINQNGNLRTREDIVFLWNLLFESSSLNHPVAKVARGVVAMMEAHSTVDNDPSNSSANTNNSVSTREEKGADGGQSGGGGGGQRQAGTEQWNTNHGLNRETNDGTKCCSKTPRQEDVEIDDEYIVKDDSARDEDKNNPTSVALPTKGPGRTRSTLSKLAIPKCHKNKGAHAGSGSKENLKHHVMTAKLGAASLWTSHDKVGGGYDDRGGNAGINIEGSSRISAETKGATMDTQERDEPFVQPSRKRKSWDTAVEQEMECNPTKTQRVETITTPFSTSTACVKVNTKELSTPKRAEHPKHHQQEPSTLASSTVMTIEVPDPHTPTGAAASTTSASSMTQHANLVEGEAKNSLPKRVQQQVKQQGSLTLPQSIPVFQTAVSDRYGPAAAAHMIATTMTNPADSQIVPPPPPLAVLPAVAVAARKQPEWELLLQKRSNKLSAKDRCRVQQFFEHRFNPTPDPTQTSYKMKLHEARMTDPQTGQAIKETYYLELNYHTFTSKQSKKVKHYTK